MRKIQVEIFDSPRKYGSPRWTRKKISCAKLLHAGRVRHASPNQRENQAFLLIHQFAKRFVVAMPAPFDELLLGNCRSSAQQIRTVQRPDCFTETILGGPPV